MVEPPVGSDGFRCPSRAIVSHPVRSSTTTLAAANWLNLVFSSPGDDLTSQLDALVGRNSTSHNRSRQFRRRGRLRDGGTRDSGAREAPAMRLSRMTTPRWMVVVLVVALILVAITQLLAPIL
jgi:hypothetical protein